MSVSALYATPDSCHLSGEIEELFTALIVTIILLGHININ